MAKVAVDFEKIVHEGRERQKNQALAQKIFSKDRRQSAPSKIKPGTGPSLASRVGVKKQRASLGPAKASSAGNINGEWTHDLHSSVNDPRNNSLASRISTPGSKNVAVGPKGKRAEKRAAKIVDALERTDLLQQKPSPASKGPGLSIRGLAGPYAVMAQNFAPGTTAADIESAMTPVGGEMISCTVIKTQPIIIVEMVFSSKEGGEAVISTFNDQTADGRLIKVYPKPGGYKDPATQRSAAAPHNAPSGPRAQRSNAGNIVDGSHGFQDEDRDDEEPYYYSTERSGLYSDKLVGNSRRGRGPQQRNRGGR
ncbi:putative RNA-binding protein like [Verticillium longisporum]|uniref:Uncharacterized protein n=2 Tax=Verticillium TaxID=1036719 RepID=A0A366QCL6_VERDA|nr:putative RNA-binding protein like [Verticillium longisporum]PNH37576.1 hypothetical protein VD0004_g9217 [Verticillium dahliae]PNH63163.1 hypothetical protein VD0001_g9229 [Verticillium dahliae]RBR01600.1 hypothetical protein VDGD_06650 [Verticillium dahliae]RXG45237.1 hypothetical protein VDGE_06650 [Verticillium dahliae]